MSLCDRAKHLGGFTLLEVLLALALTGIVVGLAGPIAVQTWRTTRYVEGKILQDIKNDYLLNSLATDLGATIDSSPGWIENSESWD